MLFHLFFENFLARRWDICRPALKKIKLTIPPVPRITMQLVYQLSGKISVIPALRNWGETWIFLGSNNIILK